MFLFKDAFFLSIELEGERGEGGKGRRRERKDISISIYSIFRNYHHKNITLFNMLNSWHDRLFVVTQHVKMTLNILIGKKKRPKGKKTQQPTNNQNESPIITEKKYGDVSVSRCHVYP